MNTVIWDADRIDSIRETVSTGGAVSGLDALRTRADAAIRLEPVSVVQKTTLPPSGDPHDYMSVGPYWWPDPDKPDGLPYIRRDGETNPERHEYDNVRLDALCSAVRDLALAGTIFRDESYSRHAAKLLRVWFLDEETRMNPHLEYGQAIPGVCEGRGVGIIDTAGRFTELVDALEVLRGSATADVWSSTDHTAIKDWMSLYLSWNLESEKGRDEAAARNNHGTYFDMQAIALGLFTDRTDVAKRIARSVASARIATQIEPDGAQPHELARTKSRSYTLMNAIGLVKLAILARRVDVDLWGFKTADGRSIRRAVEWFIPFIRGETEWRWEQIGEFDPASYVTLFLLAAGQFDESLGRIVQLLPSDDTQLVRLTCRVPPGSADVG
ncbi:MAG: hypothetical protein EA426_11115 [Spirochaetaceae bacterium]|nr:MAG: hypothetical protein EA426_11115 [Spirochaetaceae bacterium]